mgnify:CR=1 FL=1
MVKAVVGANWGDEGKGKITDMLGETSDIIVRFQGGANAGHTIINDYGKFALHTLPSGVFYNHTTSVIGNGVALNIPVLFKEIEGIVSQGVPQPKILVSDRAQMVMPYHILFDQYEEERLGGKSFGSTKSGIAPFYSDKYAKIGFQVSELFDDDLLKEKVVRVAEQKNVLLEHLYHKPLINPDDLYKELQEYKEMIAPYVCDTSLFLHNAIKEGKNILLEGQLGSLKDPDHGIYPMVTSSSTLAGYGAIGREVAVRAKAFGMEILAYDPYMPAEKIEADGARAVDLDTMLAESDMISIHLPVLPSTKGIVNKDWFSKMKPTAYVINTARAAVIDQKDFVEALMNKTIAGAAVDVYWKEPVPANHPLLSMRNVVCTPHMAGLTTDVDNWSGTMMGEEITAYLKGEPRKYIWKVKK